MKQINCLVISTIMAVLLTATLICLVFKFKEDLKDKFHIDLSNFSDQTRVIQFSFETVLLMLTFISLCDIMTRRCELFTS